MAQTPAETPATSPPAPPPSPENSGGGLALNLAGDLLKCAPKPSPGFAAAVLGEKPQPPAAPAPAAGPKIKTADYLRDKEGWIFDRRFVVVGHNQSPRKTPSGLWEMKKDPATGNRFKRAAVLKKSLRGKPGANTVRVETSTETGEGVADEPTPINRPRLVLPGMPEFDNTEQPATGVDEQPEEISAGPSPDSVALAVVIDSVYWAGLAPFLAVPQAVEAVKKNQGAAALAALTAGLDQCEDLPRLPWWVPVLTIYGMSAAAMFNHSANQEKALTIKEKIARAWLNFKHGRKKGGENRNV